MLNLLIIGDGPCDLPFVKEDYKYIDLRDDDRSNNLMDVFEKENPERSKELREEIQRLAPEKIVVLGELEGYRWLGTIVCRCFGQFNSWLGQYENDYGKTVLKINDREVPLLAMNSVDEWRMYYEKRA